MIVKLNLSIRKNFVEFSFFKEQYKAGAEIWRKKVDPERKTKFRPRTTRLHV